MAEIKVYTVEEVADMFQVTKITVYNWIREKKLRAVKLGKYYRISEDAIKEMMGE